MNEDWMKFESTGSVSDYLNYRNRVEEEARSARSDQEEEGSRERLHPVDRNGIASRSYR